MSVLEKIACAQGRKDELPNQALAKELVETHVVLGIQEVAQNLYNLDPNIQSDCLKVMYEIGYVNPALTTAYLEDFFQF